MSTVHPTTSLIDVTHNPDKTGVPVKRYTPKKKSIGKSRLINVMFAKQFNARECFLLIISVLFLFALSSMIILWSRCVMTSVNTVQGESKVR